MFDQQTYIRRRTQLKKEVGQGLIILFGNNESPANGPFNGYHPFRQDSSFLYYFGQNRYGLVGVNHCRQSRLNDKTVGTADAGAV